MPFIMLNPAATSIKISAKFSSLLIEEGRFTCEEIGLIIAGTSVTTKGGPKADIYLID